MKEKNKRNDLQSEDRESPSNSSVAAREPHVISFDVYFRKVQSRNPRVYDHHKAPMKRFAEQRGLNDATEEKFDEIFKSY
jgi:hypothetical protein